MRIGIVHPALGAETLTEVFARAAEVGAEGVEVHYASPAIATALGQESHVEELKAAAAQAGLLVPGLYLGCLCAEPALIGRPEIIEGAQRLVLRALHAASQIGAEMVTVPFFGKNAIEVEGELTRAADALLELVEPAEEEGVVLAVESTLAFHQEEFLLNHLGNTPDVGVCCNTAVALSRKLDLVTGIRHLAPQAIAQVRFKDVRMVEGEPPDFAVRLGEGNVDFRAIAQAIHAVGFDGWIIVDPPTCEDDRRAVAEAAEAVEFARSALKSAAG